MMASCEDSTTALRCDAAICASTSTVTSATVPTQPVLPSYGIRDSRRRDNDDLRLMNRDDPESRSEKRTPCLASANTPEQ
jgi:hypothetical protein